MINDAMHAIANRYSVIRVKFAGNTTAEATVTGDWSNALYGTWCFVRGAAKFIGVTTRCGKLEIPKRQRAIGGIDICTEHVILSAMIMNYNVVPLKKHAEISYHVKYVTVENERVFGDVYVTQQTRRLDHRSDKDPLPPFYRRRRRNLIQQTWNGPDFMALNKRSTGSGESSHRQKRSKSMGDEPSMIAFNYENPDAVIKKPKVNVRTMQLKIDRSPTELASLRCREV